MARFLGRRGRGGDARIEEFEQKRATEAK